MFCFLVGDSQIPSRSTKQSNGVLKPVFVVSKDAASSVVRISISAFSMSSSKQHNRAETLLHAPQTTQFITILEAKRCLVAFDLNQCLAAVIHRHKEHMCTIVSRLLTEIHAVASINRQSIM